jgi:hypothetical protein
MSDVTPRQAALWFAGKGHSVLPLHSVTDAGKCTCGYDGPDKHAVGKHPYAPLVPNGLKNATTDPEVIRAWFSECYWLNFGVVTKDLLAVDIDPRNGGDKSWAEIS